MSLTSEFPLANNVLLLRTVLQEQQRELTDAIGKTQKEIRALGNSGPGDVLDESCDNASKEAVFTTYTRNRTHLRKVEIALGRMATGEFGVCAACGGDIGLKRLQALPWANNCIKCQEKSERGRIQ